MTTRHTLRHLALGLVVCASLAPAVRAEVTPLGLVPTRLQLCQEELGGPDGSKTIAKAAMRTCLQRRSQAEATVAAQCDAQVAKVSDTEARLTQRRACVARGLRVPYATLPTGRPVKDSLAKSKSRAAQRPAARPRPRPAPKAAPAPAPAPARAPAAMPAAGEHSTPAP